MARITIRQTDDGRSLPVRLGDLICLSLAENPTTGYRWDIEEPLDALELQQDTYHSQVPKLVGGSSTRVFVFRVAGAGLIKLRLRRWRPWQGESSIEERFSIDLEASKESNP